MARRLTLGLLLVSILAISPAASQSIVPPTASGDMIFDAWASEFQGRALAAGIDSGILSREMADLKPDPGVAGADSRQPEFSKPISDYLKGVVTADRLAIGSRRRADLAAFPAIESRFGVPRDILLGVWALESGFGSIQGDRDAMRSLATLAAQGRRRAWAEGELIAILRIIESGEHPRSRLRGSWAGAMGQTQFIPSTYLATAVDQDGDGQRDIWNSSADALASAANLLAKAGWVRGQSWARKSPRRRASISALLRVRKNYLTGGLSAAWWRPTVGRGRRRTLPDRLNLRPLPERAARCSCCSPITSQSGNTTTAWLMPWASGCWQTGSRVGGRWCAPGRWKFHCRCWTG